MAEQNSPARFRTEQGFSVPSVTAEQMREVDRIATAEFGLGILQMMENAGRTLAQNVLEMLDAEEGPVAVLAGSGGNGGGGLCCARHLHNRGVDVRIILSKEEAAMAGPALHQLRILRAAGLHPEGEGSVHTVLLQSKIAVDALIGYSLRGAPRSRAAALIAACNERAARILSLDVPSGLDATTGQAPGQAIVPERTLTLALPKSGLGTVQGELYLADIGIPPTVYRRLGLRVAPLFGQRYWVRLERVERGPNRVFIALGSNIDSETNIRLAIRELAERCELRAVSPVYETKPVGTTDQPNFLNAVALVGTDLSAADLKAKVLAAIEQDLGRVRTADKNAPRTIDLDIVLFNDQILDVGHRHVPDPDILRYPHVAVPLAHISPQHRHPETGQTLREIAQGVGTDGLLPRADIDLTALLD